MNGQKKPAGKKEMLAQAMEYLEDRKQVAINNVESDEWLEKAAHEIQLKIKTGQGRDMGVPNAVRDFDKHVMGYLYDILDAGVSPSNLSIGMGIPLADLMLWFSNSVNAAKNDMNPDYIKTLMDGAIALAMDGDTVAAAKIMDVAQRKTQKMALIVGNNKNAPRVFGPYKSK